MNHYIEWIHFLDIPSCDLVTSVDDLKSGVVFCDIAACLKSRPLFDKVSRHSDVQKNFKKAALHNFKIFLEEIGPALPENLMKTPKDLYENTEILLDILAFLQSLYNKSHLGSKNTQSNPKLLRNLTPRSIISASPNNLTSRARLQHSPSMLDIRMNISRVPSTLKETIYKWLNEMKLIKNNLIEEFKDGVVLCELINRLEGKSEVIKGFQRLPKNKSTIQVNINKALTYLRGIEKIQSKYLWNPSDIIQGNEETVYGLLGSIKDYYTSKQNNSQSYRKLLKSPVQSNIIDFIDYSESVNNFGSQKNTKKPKFSISPLRKLQSFLNKSYESPKNSQRIRENIVLNNIQSENYFNNHTEFDWIYNLGLNIPPIDMHSETIDEFKSGVLLCQIVEKLERTSISGIQPKLKSNAVALHNITKALKILKSKSTFPSYLLFVEDEIIKGRGEAIRNLLRSMQKIYKHIIKSNIKFKNFEKINQTYIS
jgi:Calponin homology (CH) domain